MTKGLLTCPRDEVGRSFHVFHGLLLHTALFANSASES
jgi:hypothetical protein